MRLFSEEKHSGSFEILMTLPVSMRDVVLGKLLAGAAFVALMLAPTLSYAVSAALVGSLDPGPVIGGYLGALLLGLAFSAAGVFASSLTRNQIVAFIVGLVICLTLTLIDKFLFFLPAPCRALSNIWAPTFIFEISPAESSTRGTFCTSCLWPPSRSSGRSECSRKGDSRQ
jgi:ABC-type transport system involved in multi-copper enzyme maturation permease subunit